MWIRGDYLNKDILIYLLILLAFLSGSIYNFTKRKKCIYRVKLSKGIIIALTLAALVLLGIAYIGGNTWEKYLLSFIALIFLISGQLSEGIKEDGICFLQGRRTLIRTGKWDELKNFKFDMEKTK